MNGDWQPIETAPKDGTDILLWADGQPHIGRWKVRASRLRGYWYSDYSDEYGDILDATHWMPLPEPPKQ